MSERIVDNPANHGWVEENGKWVWEGGSTTGHIEDGTIQGQITTWDVAKTEWTPDGTMIVKGGNVGIGTSTSLTSGLDVSTSGSELAPSGAKITGRFSVGDVKSTSVMIGANDTGTPHGVIAGANALGFYTYNSGWFNRMTIDSTGNVGIGMSPLRSTAKEQLAEWKSRFDARLKDDPKADKKAVTLEITDDAFEVLPSEDKLAEWMETRAAGDKLQVSGNISASGTVKAGGSANGVGELQVTDGATYTLDVKSGGPQKVVIGGTSGTNTFAIQNNGVERLTIDASGDATFSGTAGFNTVNNPLNLFSDETHYTIGVVGSGRTEYKSFNRHEFSCVNDPTALTAFGNVEVTGTVDAAGFTVNGVPIGGGSADPIEITNGISLCGAPAARGTLYKTENALEMASAPTYGGNHGHTGFQLSCAMPGGWGTQEVYFHLGNSWGVYDTTPACTIKQAGVYAADFIATSDERLKDNITTAPVGLIDSLKGREWDWKESGEKGSGVVAQELEQVLPHLVHEDEDGMKSVSYNGLVAYLIEELKDCRQRIAELEAKA